MLRQDNALVFVRLELTPQPLGRFPDVAGEIVEFGLVESEGHGSIGGGKQDPRLGRWPERVVRPNGDCAIVPPMT